MGPNETCSMKQFLHFARDAGPYLTVALLVPGGSLIALAAWFFRNQKKNGPSL